MDVDTADALALVRAREWTANGTARRIREGARLSQREVAAVIGVSNGCVSLWEAGDRLPRGEPGLRYAQLLGALVESRGAPPCASTS
ncbi:MAG: helix-turn-helix transcriptional regulator [Solirubrobacterales bacterium]